MWFMNKVANPIVRLVLRSPFHGLLSKNLALLTYKGLKSGRLISFPVQYAKNGRDIFIIPGFPGKKTWWHNMRSALPVQLLIQGNPVNARAATLDCGAETSLAVTALESFIAKFPAAAQVYAVKKGADGKFNMEDLLDAAGSIIIVHAEMESQL
jgi:hypothetical protein